MLLRNKAHSLPRARWWLDQFLQCVEYKLDVMIVCVAPLLQFAQFARETRVGRRHPPKSDECAHHSNVDLHGALTLEQFVTSNVGRGGRRYRPYAFTQEGVAMLSAV